MANASEEALKMTFRTTALSTGEESAWAIEFEAVKPQGGVTVFLRFGDATRPAHFTDIPRDSLEKLLAFLSNE